MENDEAISVEVDGIRYDSTDQVPDKADRDKIRALISGSSDGGFDEDFDQKFEAEVRELEQQSAGAQKIIVSVFLAVGVLMLVIALISTASTIGSLARETSAPARWWI